MAEYTSDSEHVPDKLLIVADDFTGANDTGVQFCKRDLRTIVITNTGHLKKSLLNCDVLVINTESRFDNKDIAYRKTFEAGQIAKSEKISFFYKKLDSTMRGNIGAEISGLMDSLDIKHTFLVPALPAYGRTTENGNVLVNGVLLEKTEFASDPKTPVKDSYIPKIILAQTDKSTAIIDYDIILKGQIAVVKTLDAYLNENIRIIVFDARNEQDIDMIASVISGIKKKVLYAGCSGLAEYLAKYLYTKKEKLSNIVLAGSVSEVTRRQIEFAIHNLDVDLVEIDAKKLFTGEMEKEQNRILSIVKESCSKGKDIIIRSSASREDVETSFETGKKYGYDRFEVSERIARFLGETAREIIQNFKINAILFTGGDTAIKAAGCLDISGIILKDEIMHGIPYGHFAEEQYRNIIIVSKAGGFGDEDAIHCVLNFLNNNFKR